MFSEFFMGVSSNLEVFLSEKHKDHREFIATSILLTTNPTTTMEETKVHDQEQEQSHHDDDDDDLSEAKQQTVRVQEQKNNYDDSNVPVLAMPPSEIPSGLMKIKIPPYNVEEELTENDGFKTPTGPEHGIPPTLVCPPAPRKPKTTSSSPSYTAKRKVSSFRSRWLVLDFSQAIVDPLFPTTPSVVDRGTTWSSGGGKNKKVKVKRFSDDDELQN